MVYMGKRAGVLSALSVRIKEMIDEELLNRLFMRVALIGITLVATLTTATTITTAFIPAYALYIADSQTVTTTKNTPITFYLTGSAPVDFHYRTLTHPNVADTCTEGYVPFPPACDHGYMEYDGSTGQVWYTPDKDFVGIDSFTFETAAEMGPWSGDVIGVVTIVVVEEEEEKPDVLDAVEEPDVDAVVGEELELDDDTGREKSKTAAASSSEGSPGSLIIMSEKIEEATEKEPAKIRSAVNDITFWNSIVHSLNYHVNTFFEASQSIWEFLAAK